jgi:hypothetical protein
MDDFVKRSPWKRQFGQATEAEERRKESTEKKMGHLPALGVTHPNGE